MFSDVFDYFLYSYSLILLDTYTTLNILNIYTYMCILYPISNNFNIQRFAGLFIQALNVVAFQCAFCLFVNLDALVFCLWEAFEFWSSCLQRDFNVLQ